jgi:undecaprenyl-diphosphatase
MLNTLIIFGANYLYLVVIALTIYHFLKLPQPQQKRFLTLAVISLPLIFIISRLASLVYFDPRPFVVGNFIPLIPHAADNGFPSDHTLLVAACAALTFVFNQKASYPIIIIALLVGLARVASGVHHPIDIVGSIVIAVIVITAIHLIIRRQKLIRY